MKNTDIINIITKKIKNIKNELNFIEIGEVIKVYDGVVILYGLDNVSYNELIQFDNGVLGIIFNIEEDSVGAVIMAEDNMIKEGDEAKRLRKGFNCAVGKGLLGRVIDTLGNPIDGKGLIKYDYKVKVDVKAPNIISRESVYEPVQTGIKIIDILIPIGRGQRELIIGDRKTGKTTIAIDTILGQKSTNKVKEANKKLFCIYVAIGKKKSCVAKLIKNLKDKGALEYSIIVVASASDPVPLQFYAPYVGCSIGEFFRNNGMHALIIYDDLSKHAISYRQMSLLLRRPPGREAYPGDIFYIHAKLLERAAKLSNKQGGGSLTALPIVETQDSDLSAYIPTNIISITDGQIFLENELFLKGIKPAINIGLSVSRVGSAAQIQAVKKVAGTIKLDLAQFRELESFSQFASDLDLNTKKILKNGHKMTELLKQKQYSPVAIEEQVIIIFNAINGYLTSIENDKIAQYEKELLIYVKYNAKHILENIKKTKKLSSKDSISLIEHFDKFKKI